MQNSSFEIKYIHRLKEYNWGQKAIRIYDPNGHMIEVGESMEYVARRCLESGMSAEETAWKTQLGIGYVEQLIKQ